MLNEQDRQEIERRLLEERESAIEVLEQFDTELSQTLREESGELSVYRFHMADIGTESMQREKQFLLQSKEGERLYRIDDALRRLYREPETFGTCSECGRDIEMERLRLVPDAELCAEHQRAVEA